MAANRFLVTAFVVMAFVAVAISSSSSTQEVLIGLRQHNLDVLEARFWAVADPASGQYGNHMTRDEIAQLIAPSQRDIDAVVQWLQQTLQATSVSVHASRDFLTAHVPSHLLAHLHNKPVHIEALVDIFSVSSASSNTQLRVTADQCNEKATMLHAAMQRQRRDVDASPDATPNAQKRSYIIPQDLKGAHKDNSQMVWGPCTYGVLDSDMKEFYEKFDVKADVNDIKREGFHGLPGGDNFGEATLDTEYISALGLGVETIVSNTNDSWSAEEGNGFGDALLKFASDLAARDKVPLVLSMSLGSLSWDSIELMCVQTNKVNSSISYQDCLNYMQSQRQVSMYTGAAQIQRIDTEFKKLGVRGSTLLAASGDGGSHFSFVRFPAGPIGSTLNQVSCMFQFPTYPSASTYVTSVGGTQWDNSSMIPVHWSSGGGGFAWQFPMPEYQRTAVTAYLKGQGSALPPASSFNASNRAYPDVSAIANNVPIVMQGRVIPTGGTSASTPVFAGIISLINGHRLEKGLKPLGFVNKRLYDIAAAHPGKAFYDVTSGNTSCDVEGFCCNNGFQASKGWDPATGLGSPLFPGLLKYLGTDDAL